MRRSRDPGEDFVTAVGFKVGNTPRTVKADGIFVEMGMKPNADLAIALGLEMTPGGYVKVNRLNQETSMPGVYAAGDLTRRKAAGSYSRRQRVHPPESVLCSTWDRVRYKAMANAKEGRDRPGPACDRLALP